MKLCIKNLFIFSLAATMPLHAPIPLGSADGLYAPLAPGARWMSPLVGAALLYSGFIERAYNQQEDSEFRKAVRLLFYKYDGYFQPQHADDSPVKFLNPQELGIIAGLLYQQQCSREKSPLKEHGSIQTIAEALQNAHSPKPEGAMGKQIRESRHKIKQNFYKLLSAISDCCSEHPTFGEHQIDSPVLALLAAVAWYKSKNKRDLIEYLENAQRHVGPGCPIFTSVKADEKEHFLLEILIKNRYQSDWPPAVEQRRFGFAGNPPVPDCCETAIRELFNCLTFNPATHRFDIARLPLSALNISPELRNFYAGIRITPESVNDIGKGTTPQEDGQGPAWMNMVSSIEGVSYKQTQSTTPYELIPSLLNIGTLLSAILGKPITGLRSWINVLGTALTQQGSSLHISLEDPETSHDLVQKDRDLDQRSDVVHIRIRENPPRGSPRSCLLKFHIQPGSEGNAWIEREIVGEKPPEMTYAPFFQAVAQSPGSNGQ